MRPVKYPSFLKITKFINILLKITTFLTYFIKYITRGKIPRPDFFIPPHGKKFTARLFYSAPWKKFTARLFYSAPWKKFTVRHFLFRPAEKIHGPGLYKGVSCGFSLLKIHFLKIQRSLLPSKFSPKILLSSPNLQVSPSIFLNFICSVKIQITPIMCRMYQNQYNVVVISVNYIQLVQLVLISFNQG